MALITAGVIFAALGCVSEEDGLTESPGAEESKSQVIQEQPQEAQTSVVEDQPDQSQPQTAQEQTIEEVDARVSTAALGLSDECIRRLRVIADESEVEVSMRNLISQSRQIAPLVNAVNWYEIIGATIDVEFASVMDDLFATLASNAEIQATLFESQLIAHQEVRHTARICLGEE